MAYELLIQSGDKVFQPVIVGDITWKTERKSYPGELKFDIVMDDTIKNISEGNAVRFKKDNNNIFFGFIFFILAFENAFVVIIPAWVPVKNVAGIPIESNIVASIVPDIISPHDIIISSSLFVGLSFIFVHIPISVSVA